MKKAIVDFNPDEQIRQMPTDFSMYMEQRLSPDQIKAATTLVYDDPELKKTAKLKFENARHEYDKNLDFRIRRKKCRDFYIGKHWNDLMKDPKTGLTITMEEYIQSQNMVPIKQNMIRQHIKNLLGQFIENDFKSVVVARNREDQKISEMMSKALEYALQLNDTHLLDVSVFEEFLLSGAFGYKTYYGWHEDRNSDDVVTDSVHPAMMFWNTVRDVRLKDLNHIGEIHEIPIEQVISTFAKNQADKQLIESWYGQKRKSGRRDSIRATQQDSSMIDNLDFLTPYDPNLCRVIEIWEKVNIEVMIVHDPMSGKKFQSALTEDDLEQINDQRYEQFAAAGVPEENIPYLSYERRFENVWQFWFLTHNGDILMHGDTPFDHEQNPYTIGLYPLVDGNIWGFAYDILDQQIQINRLLTSLDKIIGTSSKGAMRIPKQAMADGWTVDDYANEATRSDGVLVYDADPQKNPSGRMPEEIATKNINTGHIELLQIQMNLLEQISGVTNAIQGQKAGSGTPLGMYQLQASNAQINNRIYFEFFFQRRSERDLKIVKLQQQHYTEDKNIEIVGKDFSDDIRYYEAAKGRDVDVMISMGRATNTPVMRQIQDEVLLKFLDQGLIDMNIFSELTSLPFADKLRETMNRVQQEMQMAQEQAAAQGMPTQPNPEVMAQMEQEFGMKNGKVQGLQLN